jgi:hypothetical protein
MLPGVRLQAPRIEIHVTLPKNLHIFITRTGVYQRVSNIFTTRLISGFF